MARGAAITEQPKPPGAPEQAAAEAWITPQHLRGGAQQPCLGCGRQSVDAWPAVLTLTAQAQLQRVAALADYHPIGLHLLKDPAAAANRFANACTQ